MNMLKRFYQLEVARIMRGFRNLKGLQRLSRNFSLITHESGEKVLMSGKMGIVMKIRNNGYIPKSGLLVAEQLYKLKISGKVLDIGTGETGILANCLLTLGASIVHASDIDPIAIQWAKQSSNVSPLISWHNSNLFPLSIYDEPFDIIVSNPPQMPMPSPGHPHDYGGFDGRDIIVRIIKEARYRLNYNGKLILLCFDFLGVEKSDNQATIIEIAKESGFETRVLGRHGRMIRKGGNTEKNVEWIKSVNPWYSFQRDTKGNYYHEIMILEMSLPVHPRI